MLASVSFSTVYFESLIRSLINISLHIMFSTYHKFISFWNFFNKFQWRDLNSCKFSSEELFSVKSPLVILAALLDFFIISFVYVTFSLYYHSLKDTHREKAPSKKTPALRKSTNMGVWAVGTLSQLFIRGS